MYRGICRTQPNRCLSSCRHVTLASASPCVAIGDHLCCNSGASLVPCVCRTVNLCRTISPAASPALEGQAVHWESASQRRRVRLISQHLESPNGTSYIHRYTLIQVFSKFGKISKMDYLFHKTGPLKGKPRGYAFVEYVNHAVCPFPLSVVPRTGAYPPGFSSPPADVPDPTLVRRGIARSPGARSVSDEPHLPFAC